MRIGIVGSGIAGIGTAWALDPRHQIVLFENNDHLGGHAYTVPLRYRGEDILVDPGAQFVSLRSYPNFARLLRALDIECVSSPASATLCSRTTDRSFVLTPSLRRVLRHIRPHALSSWLQLWRVIRAARQLEDSGDWGTTLDEFLATIPLTEDFRREVLLPFLGGTLDLKLDELGQASAQAVMWYPLHQWPENPLAPFEMSEVKGGIGSYVSKLVSELRHTEIKLATPVQGVRKGEAGFTVFTKNGAHTFDAVILALPPERAVEVLEGEPALRPQREVLRRFPYHHTSVAIHSDPSFMPADRRVWSTCNYVFDERASYISIWIGRREGRDLFKTWITHSLTTPREVHLQKAFRHPTMTPAYYRAQAELRTLQGRDNLWMVGSYTQGIDCHESGFRSAIQVARALAPDSPNLRRLEGADRAAHSTKAFAHVPQEVAAASAAA